MKAVLVAAACLTLTGGIVSAAFTSKLIRAFKAKAVFTRSLSGGQDVTAPVLKHTPIERISAVTKVGLIDGKVTDEAKIDSISIYYKQYAQGAWSTGTIAGAGAKAAGDENVEQEFSFKLPEAILTEDIAYRISVRDGTNTTTYPADGSWARVVIESTVKQTLESNGGTIVLKNGDAKNGQTAIVIPSGALTSPVEITITELDPADADINDGGGPALSARPVSVYRLEPKGLNFLKPISMSLLFQDTDNDGIVDNTDYPASSVRIMWWDGFDWRLMNSTVDETAKLVTSQTKHFSYYAVFPVGPVQDDDYRCKEKIITPATADGVNDYASFPMMGAGNVVNIYDINGKRVKQVSSDDMIWDGRNDSGEPVASGIYVYQFKIPGKIISGTIVVAK